MTPVTDTYSQIGKVQRAIRRWASNRSRSARHTVRSARNGTAAARTVWLIRIEKYTVRIGPYESMEIAQAQAADYFAREGELAVIRYRDAASE